MRWNTPLSQPHATLLLEQLATAAGDSVLDLGCGWGELLLRIVAASGGRGGPGRLAVGVDTDADLLERGQALARERGLADSVGFSCAAAQTWTEPADRLVCLGASHAWGGTEATLTALRKLVNPGGRLLFGDGCWEPAPTQAAAAIFDDVLPLAEIVSHAQAAGWRLLYLDTATQREWDEFESTWRQGCEAWLRKNRHDPRGASLRDEIDARVLEYVGDYRGVLGFCYLILSAG